MWTASTDDDAIIAGAPAFDPADLSRASDGSIEATDAWHDRHQGVWPRATQGFATAAPSHSVFGAASSKTRTSARNRRAGHKTHAIVMASEKPATRVDPFGFSFSIAALSDNRRAGTSRSDGHPALVSGVDISAPWGLSAGLRASVADRRKSNVEIALYGAKSFEFGRTELSLGATTIISPGGDHDSFSFAQASISRAIGPIDATLAVNYAWAQRNLDHEDNLYVVLRARTPMGHINDVPVTLGASVGRTEGHFAIAASRVDWSVSLTGNFHGTDVGLTYTDTDLDDPRGDPAVVLSITHRF